MIEQSALKLKAPPNSCDCHIHVYDASYPTAKTAKVLPPPASVEQYLAVRKNLGIDRTVVVQASAYGTDNSLLLKTMGQIGPGARGIVVVDDSVTDAELDRLTKLGVRGIRFFMLAGAPLPIELMEPMAARRPA
jgi:D-galactarolactone isomerase